MVSKGKGGVGGGGNKTKTRFDGLDVAAMTAFIKRSLLGHKLANVYDGVALSAAVGDSSSGKGTFVFKLANPSAKNTTNDAVESNSNAANTNSNRSMLLIESGVRFHITTFYSNAESSSNSIPPSQFAMKLRKHLRNLRLENIHQLGNLDRVVDLRFGSGENAHHLIVELYGLGNIILTNDKYVILALLRVHQYTTPNVTKDNQNEIKDISSTSGAPTNEQVQVRVGNVYPVTYATTISTPSQDGQSSNDSKEDLSTRINKSSILDMNGTESFEWAYTQLQTLQRKENMDSSSAAIATDNKKKKKKKKDNNKDGSTNLKMLLLKPNSGVFHYGPSLIEHCILCADLEPTAKFTLDTIESIMPPSNWERLVNLLRNEGSRILDNFNTGDGTGYVLYREKEANIDTNDKTNTVGDELQKMPHSDKVFEEFQPHLLRQHQDRPKLSYDNFSLAVDEFYSLIEGQKRAIRAEAAESAAKERLEKIRQDQSKRVEGLESEMVRLKEHAELVELHADDVDKALGVINSALDSGMDWEALSDLVEVEKANMNPIALLIKKLVLDKDAIVLSLPDTMSWDPNDHSSPPIVDVTVSLKEGAYANARIMYEKYRASKEKATKTAEAADMALKAAELNAQRQIEQAQKSKNMTYSVMMPQRKQHWFEKFHWFITSDNYIVIGGRDAQQNEILVKRYLRPGDAYLHADVHGAPTCVLRAKRRRTSKGATEVLPLSEQALREAGNFAICKSSAWKSRMVTSAWWVESHQVSKTAPTGEYLTVGSFMIRGRKNFLPPSSLEMGLGVLFRLGDDVSIARHVNERRDFALMALDEKNDELIHVSMNKVIPKSNQRLQDNNSDDSDMDDNSFVKIESKETLQNTVKLQKEVANKDEVTEIPDLAQENFNIDSRENESEKVTKRKGFSARERKLIKKYGSLEAAEEVLSKLREEEKERLAKQNTKKEKSNDNIVPQRNSVRGKKAKMKKMSKKYADQDDEDRELALLALQGSQKEKTKGKKGSKNNSTIQPSASQAKVAAETAALLVRDSAEVIEKLDKEIQDILRQCLQSKAIPSDDDKIKWQKLDAEVLEQLMALESKDAQKAAASRLLQLTESTRIDNFSASLAGIIRTVNKYGFEGIQLDPDVSSDGKQRKTKAEKAAEKEAWREILAEDGIIDVDNETEGPVDDTLEINKLTGKPLPEDVVLYALPVCAPYHVLAQYKYRVKLTPGSGKRGKASKQCVDMFCKSEDQKKGNQSNIKFVEAIKAVNDNEWVQAICGDVKISAPGASKAIKKQKSGIKKNR